MRVKFLADANLNRGIADGLRRRESLVDFLSGEEAGLAGKSDFDVLGIAAGLERIVVTHDRKTMPLAFGRFIADRASYGLLIVPQNLGLRGAIDDLLLIWSASDAEGWLNMIAPIPL